MKKLLSSILLFLSINHTFCEIIKTNKLSIYLYPTNFIERKGEVLSLAFLRTNNISIDKITLEDVLEFYPTQINENISFSLIPIPHTILTDFNIYIYYKDDSNVIEKFNIPVYVKIDPISYAKKKPLHLKKEIFISNSFKFKTNRLPKTDNVFFENTVSLNKPIDVQIKDKYGVNRSKGGIIEGRIHLGIDMLGYLGHPVYASQKGIVTRTFRGKKEGNCVVIYHGLGISTVYMHLQKILVKPGEIVNTNTVIGTVGSTGLSTGPHLHFGVSLHQIYVDPEVFISRDYSYISTVSNGMLIQPEVR